MNPATEFVQALISFDEEEPAFSPKHLAEFAVETLSDPYIKIKDLSIMISYILTLIADRATWPGQRERIRKRFAEAVGRIPRVKFEYWLKEDSGSRSYLKQQAVAASEALVRECRKVNDDEFIARTMKHLQRNLQSITSGRRKSR